jgi:hypothetical protein
MSNSLPVSSFSALRARPRGIFFCEVHAEDVGASGWQLAKADMAAETSGVLVGVPDKQVYTARAVLTKGSHERCDQLPPRPAPLHSRHEVDMQV